MRVTGFISFGRIGHSLFATAAAGIKPPTTTDDTSAGASVQRTCRQDHLDAIIAFDCYNLSLL